MKYNRIDIKWRLASTSFKIYLEILSNLYITFMICYYNTINIFHSSVHFFPVLVKGLYQTESYSLHVMHLNDSENFYFPHLVVWGRYCACEILIANTIDRLYAACLEYFIFSRSTVQKLENNMINIVC